MLHWLAGAKAGEGSNDPDTTGFMEPPETPAPVFAVRAFKHAIFGTPQTAQPNSKPRRHSNTDNARPRPSETRPTRPNMTRPKSTNDAQVFMRASAESNEDPPSSPTKGILLTPGTTTTKRKNVTFGEHVLDNEGKRQTRSGIPDDCPGKFPSPAVRSTDVFDALDGPTEKRRTRGKLTEALEQARDESARKQAREEVRSRRHDAGVEDLDDEVAEPQSESGRYWKREYDIYRENTTREVKKLITKQKSAKAFAKTKDEQCTLLADHLRQEQSRADKLEAGTKELVERVKELEELLQLSQQAARKYEDEVMSLKKQLDRKAPGRPHTSDGPKAIPGSDEPEQRDRKDSVANAQSHLADRASKPTQDVPIVDAALRNTRRPPELQNQSLRKDARDGTSNKQLPALPREDEPGKDSQHRSLNARTRSRPEMQSRKGEDLWAPSSSPTATRKTDRHSVSPKARNSAAVIGANAPLKAINVNTVPSGPSDDRDSHIRASQPEYASTSLPVRTNNKTSTDVKDTWIDAPLLSPSHLTATAEEPSYARETRGSGSPRRREANREEQRPMESSMPIPESSPFQPDAKTKVTAAGIAARSAAGLPQVLPESQVAPPVPAHRDPIATAATSSSAAAAATTTTAVGSTTIKPSAMWSSINASTQQPQGSKRVTSLMGKDGREVDTARLEAARARIAARGRVVS